MSNENNRVNWDAVRDLSERHGLCALSTAYGLPEICDPSHSRLLLDDVDIQPRWEIPDKIAISTTVTGGFYSKVTNPCQPISAKDIYESARECCLAGAPIVHIHARDAAGYNATDAALLHGIIDPLREEFPETVFDGCVVPWAGGGWEAMRAVLKDRLLDVTPINAVTTYCGDTLFSKPPHVMIEKARLCQKYGVKPQVAIYSDGDIDNAARYLIRSGLLDDPIHFLILPAIPGCSPMPNAKGMVENLMHLHNRIRDVAPEAVVMVCAAGRASSYLATQAVLLGLDIRVGMEDTVWMWPHKDTKIESNAAQFRMFSELCGLLGRTVCSPNDYRSAVGIPER